MSWIVEELASPQGVELCRGKIKADTVIMVAREDASTADSSTGRGVTTSRETVAKRLGMSGRHVGTARSVLESLGASVTIVRGRHLSPQERSLARKAHGGYQEAAGSVRALTMPPLTTEARTGAPGGPEPVISDDPVDTFHLPRRGSVNKTPPVKKYLPTRAEAREKAAPRPKPRKKSHRTTQRPPRDVETQRFVWAIAQRFLLSDSSAPRPGGPVLPGVLRGARHIGHLARILERNRVTPRRYTPQSLADALQRLITAGKLPAPRYDSIHDPLAYFAWTLRRLNELTEGETTLERIRRESEERQAQARIAKRLQPTEVDRAASQEAAAEFFAASKRLRQPKLRERHSQISDLVAAVIGSNGRLYEASPDVQQMVGDLTLLHKTLQRAGWQLSPAHEQLTWTHEHQSLVVRLSTDLPRTIVTVTTTVGDDVVAETITHFQQQYATRGN